MLAVVVMVCVLLVGGVSADGHLEKPRNYDFNYAVQDVEAGSDFGHQETRKDGVTSGSYRVFLPDGRLQVVTYTARPGGFVAEVKYEGEPVFPPPPPFIPHHHGHIPFHPAPPPPHHHIHHGHVY
ncbi:pro-resilin-like [Portunus trituberculatus]|uniref:pro-resilin-like n=1 Tax=Portunus trituberculatus TaxID=210409 RepID=UPI001E1CC58F|nr:pro-resilin-like [Portunus trituberculatus]